MQTQLVKKCPECKVKGVVLWEQVCGIRLVTDVDGRQCYTAKCPECQHEWYVRKS